MNKYTVDCQSNTVKLYNKYTSYQQIQQYKVIQSWFETENSIFIHDYDTIYQIFKNDDVLTQQMVIKSQMLQLLNKTQLFYIDNSLYIFSGLHTKTKFTQQKLYKIDLCAQKYNLREQQLELPPSRCGACCQLVNNRVYMIAGYQSTAYDENFCTDIWCFDGLRFKLISLTERLGNLCTVNAISFTFNNLIILIGGICGDEKHHSSQIYVFDTENYKLREVNINLKQELLQKQIYSFQNGVIQSQDMSFNLLNLKQYTSFDFN